MVESRIESKHFFNSGLINHFDKITRRAVADAVQKNFYEMAKSTAVTDYFSTILGAVLCGISILRVDLFSE